MWKTVEFCDCYPIIAESCGLKGIQTLYTCGAARQKQTLRKKAVHATCGTVGKGTARLGQGYCCSR